jgi:uncharacterized DUF497 family protein
MGRPEGPEELRKHGVPFEEAATVFSDRDGLDWEDLEHANAERLSEVEK